MDTAGDTATLPTAPLQIADASQVYVAKMNEVNRLEKLLQDVTACAENDKQQQRARREDLLTFPRGTDPDVVRAGVTYAGVIEAGITKSTQKIIALRQQIAAKALEVESTRAFEIMVSLAPKELQPPATGRDALADPLNGPQAKKAALAMKGLRATEPLDDLTGAFAAALVKYAARDAAVYKTRRDIAGNLISNGELFLVCIELKDLCIPMYIESSRWGLFEIREDLKERAYTASAAAVTPRLMMHQLYAFASTHIKQLHIEAGRSYLPPSARPMPYKNIEDHNVVRAMPYPNIEDRNVGRAMPYPNIEDREVAHAPPCSFSLRCSQGPPE